MDRITSDVYHPQPPEIGRIKTHTKYEAKDTSEKKLYHLGYLIYGYI